MIFKETFLLQPPPSPQQAPSVGNFPNALNPMRSPELDQDQGYQGDLLSAPSINR